MKIKISLRKDCFWGKLKILTTTFIFLGKIRVKIY